MSETCCEKKVIVNLAFHGGRVNKICTKCGTHWYGTEKIVNRYTKSEWDAWMNSADEKAVSREIATTQPMTPMMDEAIWAALDKGELAMCPQCGVKTKTPLPENWVWDSPEMHYWAWCPKCNLHQVRAAAQPTQEG